MRRLACLQPPPTIWPVSRLAVHRRSATTRCLARDPAPAPAPQPISSVRRRQRSRIEAAQWPRRASQFSSQTRRIWLRSCPLNRRESSPLTSRSAVSSLLCKRKRRSIEKAVGWE